MDVSKDMLLTDMESDVIGEVMNISLGSSATSLSSLLNQRVEITVPKVKITSAEKFDFEDLEPAIGVEIKYISGIDGDNVMILKKSDIRVILESLMGTEIPADEFVLDDIALSAICEVMNQMMGSAATALADFLGKRVDISTPIAYEIIDKNDFKGRYFEKHDNIVAVKFNLKVGDVINSEFINVISVPLAKEMVHLFLNGTGLVDDDTQKIEEKIDSPKEEIKENIQEDVQENKEDYDTPSKSKEERNMPKRSKHRIEDDYDDDYYEEDYEDDYFEEDYEEVKRKKTRRPKRRRKPVNVSPVNYVNFDEDEDILSGEQLENLGLIMSVPLQVSVEIGRTKKKIKEILEMQQGTIVELNKQAGAQVDIIVNGQVIAKGDVVVVNDNFGVRVTEIIKKDELVKLAK